MSCYKTYSPSDKNCKYLHIDMKDDEFLCPLDSIEIGTYCYSIRLKGNFYKKYDISDISILEGYALFESCFKMCNDVVVLPFSKIDFLREIKNIDEFKWATITYKQALDKIEKDKNQIRENKLFNKILNFFKIKKK